MDDETRRNQERLTELRLRILSLEHEVEALKASTKSVPPARAGYAMTELQCTIPAEQVRVLHMDAAMREAPGDAVKNAAVEHFLSRMRPVVTGFIGIKHEKSKTDPLGGFDITATLLLGTPK